MYIQPVVYSTSGYAYRHNFIWVGVLFRSCGAKTAKISQFRPNFTFCGDSCSSPFTDPGQKNTGERKGNEAQVQGKLPLQNDRLDRKKKKRHEHCVVCTWCAELDSE